MKEGDKEGVTLIFKVRKLFSSFNFFENTSLYFKGMGESGKNRVGRTTSDLILI